MNRFNFPLHEHAIYFVKLFLFLFFNSDDIKNSFLIWLLALILIIKPHHTPPRSTIPWYSRLLNSTRKKAAHNTQCTRFSERLNCNWNVYSISEIPAETFYFLDDIFHFYKFTRRVFFLHSRAISWSSREFNPFLCNVIVQI